MKKFSKSPLDAGTKTFAFDAMQLLSREMYEIKGGLSVQCTSCSTSCTTCTSACSSTCATCTHVLG